MISGEELREVMGRFPTGVAVVATRGQDGSLCGLTVNSLTSVSLDPPLLLVCLDRSSTSHDRLIGSASFSVSILAAGQEDVARRFSSEPAERRFLEVPWRPGPGGDPILEGAAGWLSCAVEGIHPGGDHSILVGRVSAVGVGESSSLAFHRGAFTSVGE